MNGQGCEWPDGCNQGAFRTVSMADGSTLRLCLAHAGRRWSERRSENRAAGRCPCGAEADEGFKTCAPCREAERVKRKRTRNLAKRAAECGVVLPRANGRRVAFIRAYSRAWSRAQNAVRRAERKAAKRAPIRWLTCPGWEAVALETWEGRPIAVRAVLARHQDGFGWRLSCCGEPAPQGAA